MLAVLGVAAQATGARAGVDPGAEFGVLAYLPEWRYEGANWDVICEHVSHLIVFSLEVKPDGGLGALDRIPRPALMAEAQAAASAHDTALLICFGGNGRSGGFSAMVRSETARARFLVNLQRLMAKHGFDGVDYNWEYPGYQFGRGYLPEAEVQADYAGLQLLFAETRQALGAAAPITMSYYPDGRQEQLLMQGGAPASLDYLMMMSYDQSPPKHHSELGWGNEMIEQGVRLFSQAALQVAAGLPFYGRHNTDGNWVTYEDIVQRHHPLKAQIDEVPSTDDGGSPSKLGFNGVSTIEARTSFAAARIGGVMIWEVGQDCRLLPTVHKDGSRHVRTCPGEEGDESQSLLAAITRAREAAGRPLQRFVRGGGSGSDGHGGEL
eukprot:COSAG01_NODE_6136_length_3827_cov_4.176628_2_plen_380_part_00